MASKKILAKSPKKKTPKAADNKQPKKILPIELSYEAFCFSQRGAQEPQMVIFHAPVADVVEWATVGMLGPKTGGAQRERKEARVQAISKFLAADAHNTIPTAIVLAFNKGKATFTNISGDGNSDLGILTVTAGPEPAANIVDGQHRIYGMHLFAPTTRVAIVGLLNVDEVEKAFQFLVINNKSSRVPPTHTKALLAKFSASSLGARLSGARLAFDVDGIKDVDLINADIESPFYQTIDWTTTPREKRMVQATAIEISLDYMAGLGIPEFEDRDVRRSVFLTIWKTIKTQWSKVWYRDSRLVSKVGLFCLTRFIADRITNWADNEDLDIEVTNLEQVEEQTRKIIKNIDIRFWTAPWAQKAEGGFDTKQGRERVLDAITQLFRNGRRGLDWHTDIEIIDHSDPGDK